MGAYGAERTKQSLQDFPVVDSEEEEEKVREQLDLHSVCTALSGYVESYPQLANSVLIRYLIC